MKLPIEQWLDERLESRNVVELFYEAVVCYKNGAYRASLLLSYLGFLTIVKETLLKSKPAKGYIEAEWESEIRKNVSNHDGWEEAVTNILLINTSGRKKPVFRLTDDLREQIQYWRKRRNDAAHNKDNEIGAHHTESIWSFIKSNIPKIAVDGGMEGLLNKFSDHFDDEKTAPGSDFRPLVREISNSVVESELPTFFDLLPERLDGAVWYITSHTTDVLNEVFNLSDEKVIDAASVYLKQKNRDLKFLNSHPNRLTLLKYDSAEIRKLWKTRLFSPAFTFNPFNIFCELVRNDFVPTTELSSIHTKLFDSYNQRSRSFLPENSRDAQTLLDCGFFDYIFQRVIITENLKWVKDVNAKCDLIVTFVEYYPLNLKTVQSICYLGNQGWASNWLIEALERLFSEKPLLHSTFCKIAHDNAVEIPTSLSK